MLVQIQFQSIDDPEKTAFVAQGEFREIGLFHDWFRDIQAEHPLPERYRWLVCSEASEQFMLASE